MNITLQQLREAVSIKEQIQKLEDRLATIVGKTPPVAAPVKKRRTKMSAAARAKISASTKARWAKIKSKSATAVVAPKKKGGLTPEGRARLAALMKARWAARKKGALAPTARK